MNDKNPNNFYRKEFFDSLLERVSQTEKNTSVMNKELGGVKKNVEWLIWAVRLVIGGIVTSIVIGIVGIFVK